MSAVHEIARLIRRLARLTARAVILDVGSGTGRYLESVLAVSGPETTRRCCAIRYDVLREMLGEEWRRSGRPCGSLWSVVGFAECLPFAADTIDAVLAFNAIHHFDVSPFLAEVGRVLRPGGRVVIYTRTPEQNCRTIWGKFFPRFADREDRLLTGTDLMAALDRTGDFRGVELHVLPWTVDTNLTRLIDQARSGAYSTFEFYPRPEFEDALATFERRVREHFEDPSRIVVQNDHLLVVAIRESHPTANMVRRHSALRCDELVVVSTVRESGRRGFDALADRGGRVGRNGEINPRLPGPHSR